jgi:hypothetical protein
MAIRVTFANEKWANAILGHALTLNTAAGEEKVAVIDFITTDEISFGPWVHNNGPATVKTENLAGERCGEVKFWTVTSELVRHKDGYDVSKYTVKEIDMLDLNRSPAIQEMVGVMEKVFAISKDFAAASNHDLLCRCDLCLAYWLQTGPDPDNGKYGPFRDEEIKAYAEVLRCCVD